MGQVCNLSGRGHRCLNSGQVRCGGENRLKTCSTFRAPQSTFSNSGWWHGRPLRPSFEAGNQARKAPNLCWRCHEPCFSHEHRLKLFHRLRRERLRVVFFLFLTFLDRQAQRAGMLPIEGFFHGFRDAVFTQVADQHAGPRHALQHCPVQAERQAQQQNQRTPSPASQTAYGTNGMHGKGHEEGGGFEPLIRR